MRVGFGARYVKFVSAMDELVSDHPTLCSRIDIGPAHQSRRTVVALRISPAEADPTRPVALVMGGIHSRELAPPAAVLAFAVNLVKAYAADRDVTYPAFSDGAVPYKRWVIKGSEVKRMLDGLVLILVPVVNPDGRDEVVINRNAIWRGNRNLTACPQFGVDLNRNFDIAWDTSKYYSEADEREIIPDGTNPSCTDDGFRGPAPQPGQARTIEDETLNIQRLIDDNDVRFFVDVHMHGRRILTPWGLADNQDEDPIQSFQNTDLDREDGTGGRNVIDGLYKEFMPNDRPDQVKDTHDQLANTMARAIQDQAGPNSTAQTRSKYTVLQIPYLYGGHVNRRILPVPGNSVDYALSRQFKTGEPKPAFAFVLETGYQFKGLPGDDPESEGGFRPTNPTKYRKIERETHAALAALLTAAVTKRKKR